MPTGACGIDCDVCGLNLRGICSTCGSGTSREGDLKAAAQERILGAPCPMLACARLNRIEYCPRDCRDFPCANFSEGPYPYSSGYLKMQSRRAREGLAVRTPYGGHVDIPPEHWEDVGRRDPVRICEDAAAAMDASGGIIVRFLNEDVRVNIDRRRIEQRAGNSWQPMDAAYLELVLLVYLLHAGPNTVTGETVSEKDLKSAHFFQGPHRIRTDHLLKRFGRSPDAFAAAGKRLGAETVHMADAGIRLAALPKIPLTYLLWAEDDEFPASMSVLFDRSIERHLKADAIWGLVNLVSDRLLTA